MDMGRQAEVRQQDAFVRLQVFRVDVGFDIPRQGVFGIPGIPKSSLRLVSKGSTRLLAPPGSAYRRIK